MLVLSYVIEGLHMGTDTWSLGTCLIKIVLITKLTKRTNICNENVNDQIETF
jgi:hypothetical protein